jgi:hypothetical protein
MGLDSEELLALDWGKRSKDAPDFRHNRSMPGTGERRIEMMTEVTAYKSQTA